MSSANDLEAQEDEIVALSSIYDENQFGLSKDEQDDESKQKSGWFKASQFLPSPFTLISPVVGETEETEEHHIIKHLSPITLYFSFPENYPSKVLPRYSLECVWLTRKQLASICKTLDQMWDECPGEVVLFRWIGFLQDDLLDFLSITDSIDLGVVVHEIRHRHRRLSQLQNAELPQVEANCDMKIVQNLESWTQVLPSLLDYNEAELQRTFNTSIFSCKVCLSEKLGSQCMCFNTCDHVYCKDCMREYFTIQIRDGSVGALTCPEEKCNSQALPSQVRELVDPELFNRYDRILLTRSLDNMGDIAYCPRMTCEYPVLVERDSNLGNCPACGYVFCILCKYTYHGVAPCRFKPEERRKLRDIYLRGTDAERAQMESKYGKKTLQHIVENTFSEDWVAEHSKHCPKCNSSIEKIDGCNKMTCFKCQTAFCWLCMKVLQNINPYSHFNTPGNHCFNQLFQGIDVMEEQDSDDDDWWL